MTSRGDTQRLLAAVEVLLDEVETYRRTGNKLHLAHAARAIEDLKSDLRAMMSGAAPAS